MTVFGEFEKSVTGATVASLKVFPLYTCGRTEVHHDEPQYSIYCFSRLAWKVAYITALAVLL
jgi:hypothetical protein